MLDRILIQLMKKLKYQLQFLDEKPTSFKEYVEKNLPWIE
jgi:hypothetical protein